MTGRILSVGIGVAAFIALFLFLFKLDTLIGGF